MILKPVPILVVKCLRSRLNGIIFMKLRIRGQVQIVRACTQSDLRSVEVKRSKLKERKYDSAERKNHVGKQSGKG